MEVSLLGSAVYIHPGDPVEFPVAVDGKSVRVAVEWPVIAHLMGSSTTDVDRVRDFLHRRRENVARALKAHLYARGVPQDGYLVMSRDDFDAIRRATPAGAESPSRSSGNADSPEARERNLHGDADD